MHITLGQLRVNRREQQNSITVWHSRCAMLLWLGFKCFVFKHGNANLASRPQWTIGRALGPCNGVVPSWSILLYWNTTAPTFRIYCTPKMTSESRMQHMGSDRQRVTKPIMTKSIWVTISEMKISNLQITYGSNFFGYPVDDNEYVC